MRNYLVYLIIILLLMILTIAYIKLYNRLSKLRIKVEESCADIDVALEKRFDLLSEQLEAVKKFLSHEYKLLTDITAIRAGAEQEEKRWIQQKQLTEEALETIDKQISLQTQNMESIKMQLEQSSLRRNRKRNSVKRRDAKKRLDKEQELAKSEEKRDMSIIQRINLLANAQNSLTNVGANVDALGEQYPVLNSWVSMDAFQRSIMNSEEHLQAARRLYNSNVSLYNQTLISIPWSIVAKLCHMERASFYEVEDHKRTFSVDFD